MAGKIQFSAADIDVGTWMRKLEVSQFTAMHLPGSRIPIMALHRVNNGVDEFLLEVHFQKRQNGVHVYFNAWPRAKSVPQLHIILQRREGRRVTCGIMACLALMAINPQFETSGRARDQWLRRAYEVIYLDTIKNGTKSMNGVVRPIIDATALCIASFNKAAGLDVDDAIESAKQAFKVLHNHWSEEDVVKLWREVIAGYVMES
jgi:hypothetical protein